MPPIVFFVVFAEWTFRENIPPLIFYYISVVKTTWEIFLNYSIFIKCTKKAGFRLSGTIKKPPGAFPAPGDL